MTQTIEPGFYMVEVLSGVLKKDPSLAVIKCRDDTGGFYYADQGPAQFISKSCLLPLPEPDKLTELERRVVETAIARHIAYKECDASRANSGGYTRDVAIARAADSSAKAHREAVDAMIVAQAPKDPVQELREAWTDWNAGGDGHRTAYRRLERAITALEAAR